MKILALLAIAGIVVYLILAIAAGIMIYQVITEGRGE